MTTVENGAKVQPRLKQRYREEIKDALNKEFNYANVMQIPGVVKVVVNMGVGDAARDAKLINGAVNDLALITGQKPEIRKARKSIAQFKLREGMPIGARVTLRGDRMWEFLDRLVSIALPRIRDFRGLSPKQFDGSGNYTFGLSEQSVFHEIDVDSIDRPRGMDITVVTTATNDDEGAEVRGSRLHPVQPVRPSARGVPQVRPVPDLLARNGARGRTARCPEVQLVTSIHSNSNFGRPRVSIDRMGTAARKVNRLS